MNIEFDQGSQNRSAGSGGGGSNTRLLLLVLLLLVAVFGYLFYFTDLIRPRQEAQTPEPPQTTQVKQPIPPRPADQPQPGASTEPQTPTPAGTAAGTPAVSEPPKSQGEQKGGEKAKVETAKVEPSKPVKPETPVPKKEQPKPVEQPKASTPAKPVNGEAAKPAVTPAKQKPASAEDGPKKMAGKGETAGTTPKPQAKPKAGPSAKPVASKATARADVPAKPAPSKGSGEYTLRIGEYVVPMEMEKDRAKVREAGLTPIVRGGEKKKEPMVRLLFGEFADRAAAERELQRIQGATVEGFILNEDGKYRVYAGSYFLPERAERERERLEGLGFRVTSRKVMVSVPTILLTAGKYGSRDEALKDAARLRKKGLSPSVIQNGR